MNFLTVFKYIELFLSFHLDICGLVEQRLCIKLPDVQDFSRRVQEDPESHQCIYL